jgi:hypothetical protein
MSRRLPVAPIGALALCLVALLVGCGGGGDQTTTAGLGELTTNQIANSLEQRVAGFLARDDTTLANSLSRFIGSKFSTKVVKGSSECKTGQETASIANPGKYPFACVVSAIADGRGLTVEVTLGFVGTGVNGRCWKAVNERIAATTTAPVLLTRRQALAPENLISGCT